MKVIFIKRTWPRWCLGCALLLHPSLAFGAEGVAGSDESGADDASAAPGATDDSSSTSPSERTSDETRDESSAREPSVEMPAVLDAPAPQYPEVPLQDRVQVVVELVLTLDAQGRVTEAEVARSVGPAFDEEALRAARLYKFSPARRDGVATSARIAVQVQFEPPAAPQTAEPTPGAPIVPLAVEETAGSDEAGQAAEGPPSEPAEEEVTVLGEQDIQEKLVQSADSVTVVDLERQKQQSTDMGEVLARTPGLVVRRSGGVGSDVRISLNGLYDQAVRQFVDSVPLWMTALPDNAGALPVNLFERVEIYRGVVPLRLAADALGGAINFVTDKSYENHGAVSFQTGSFGTYRGTALAQYRHEPSHFVARVMAYGDSVKNDYKVDVEVPDESGRPSAATVRLFHKAYAAYGGAVEAGLVDTAWAKRFLVRGFFAGTKTEIQHNQVMSVPYGEPWWNDRSYGAALIYDQEFGDHVVLNTTTNYAHRAVHLDDLGRYVYNWRGEREWERAEPGEITSDAADKTAWRNSVFHRSMLEWAISPEHVVLASLTPLFSTETGRDELWEADFPDPLSANNTLLSMVSGLGYELNLVPLPGAPKDPQRRRRGTDFRLQNTFNVKSYLYKVQSTEELTSGGLRTHDVETHNFGIADGLRWALTRELFLKGSYEYARRLPDPYEIFGDGALVTANHDLVPEVSHNANAGVLLDWKETLAGDFVAMTNVAYRNTRDMIVLLGTPQYLTYRNVYHAVTWAGEGGLTWTSPRRYVTLDWSGTYNDSRNRSESGTFAEFAGDQIPNRSPWGTSWGVRLEFRDIFMKRDRIEPFYQGRYTEGFYRSWESQGITEYKDRVEDQVAHDAGLTYVTQWSHLRLTNTIEVQNLADAALFDDFGVQRPGRAFYWKIMGEGF